MNGLTLPEVRGSGRPNPAANAARRPKVTGQWSRSARKCARSQFLEIIAPFVREFEKRLPSPPAGYQVRVRLLKTRSLTQKETTGAGARKSRRGGGDGIVAILRDRSGSVRERRYYASKTQAFWDILGQKHSIAAGEKYLAREGWKLSDSEDLDVVRNIDHGNGGLSCRTYGPFEGIQHIANKE